MRLVREPVAVGRATSGPVPVLDVLRLAAPGFDFDLPPLVFIDRLFDRYLPLTLVELRHEVCRAGEPILQLDNLGNAWVRR